jgi:hypothetical protein
MRAINYAKEQASSHPSLQTLGVTTCFSGTVLQPNTPGATTWEPVVKACMHSVFLTIYPWYGNSPPGNIDGNMKWSYDNGMKQVEALNKYVVIGEIGWPSQGGRETSVQNEELNYKVTDKWVQGGNFLKKNYFSFGSKCLTSLGRPKRVRTGPIGVCMDLEPLQKKSSKSLCELLRTSSPRLRLALSNGARRCQRIECLTLEPALVRREPEIVGMALSSIAEIEHSAPVTGRPKTALI